MMLFARDVVRLGEIKTMLSINASRFAAVVVIIAACGTPEREPRSGSSAVSPHREAASLEAAAGAPTNDDFDAAQVVSALPFTVALSTVEATTAYDDPSCFGNAASVWFAFTPVVDTYLEANTLGSTYDTTLSVYVGTRGALIPLACNDDFQGSQSRVEVMLSAGTTYYLMVGAYYYPGQGGSLQFSMSALEGPAVEVDLGIVGGADPPIAYQGLENSAGFHVFNDGPYRATNVQVEVALSGPGRITLVELDNEPCVSNSDTTATCALATLDGWAGRGLLLRYVGLEEGQVVITSTVVADQTDPNTYNNTATVNLDVVRPNLTDLAVSIDSRHAVKVHREITSLVAVRNNGPATASSVVMTATIVSTDARTVSVTATQGTCNVWYTDVVYCVVGALAAGETATVTIVSRADVEGRFISTAIVENEAWWLHQVDPDPSNNSQQTKTQVIETGSPMTTTTSQQRIPVNFSAYVPCANDFVFLDGTMHAYFQSQANPDIGLFSYDSLFNAAGISGFGLNSGETYHGTGVTRSALRSSSSFDSNIYQNISRIIGENTGNDLVLHQTMIVRVEPDGSVKAEVLKETVDCK
jgi:hypothetical protein